LRRRKLGSTGLSVSEIGFGAWQLGNNEDWGGMDDTTAHRLVAEAIDAGINLFDTAPNYAATHSERLLGEALRGKRAGVVLVSKFGHRADGTRDFSVDGFWKSLHGSLRRLKTDYLDVILLHNPDSQLYVDTDLLWAALQEAREQGKVRHYGASLDLAQEVEACLKNTKSEVLEILFNILHQDVRRAFTLVREREVGTIVKVPLDSGWLTGRFNAQSRFNGVRERWSVEDITQRAKLIRRLSWLTEDGSELTHKAIGYLLSYDEVDCVIPGIRTHEQLSDNLEAVHHRLSLRERVKLEGFWKEFTENGKNLLPW